MRGTGRLRRAMQRIGSSSQTKLPHRMRHLAVVHRVVVAAGLFGTPLLFGDGMITSRASHQA
jgi:hypothetical protein